MDGIDLRWFGKNSTEAEQRINAYLSDPLVQTALNIDEPHHVIPYKMMNMEVYHQFSLDSIKSYASLYDDLVDNGVTVFILTADFDLLDGPSGQ